MSLSSNSWIFASRVFCYFLTGELFTWLLLVTRSHGPRPLDSLLDPLLSHYPRPPDREVVLRLGFLFVGRANEETACPAVSATRLPSCLDRRARACLAGGRVTGGIGALVMVVASNSLPLAPAARPLAWTAANLFFLA